MQLYDGRACHAGRYSSGARASSSPPPPSRAGNPGTAQRLESRPLGESTGIHNGNHFPASA